MLPTLFSWVIGSKFGRAVGMVVAFLFMLLGVFLAGRNAEKRNEAVKKLKRYRDTRKDMDDVEIGTDADDARDRLRNRPK